MYKRIGVTGQGISPQTHPETPIHVVRTSYIRVLEDMGVLPFIIPNTHIPATEYVSMLDGLVLTGGGDIHPSLYQADAHPETGKGHHPVDTDRDRAELELVRECIRQKKPILGICRGAQLLNVAFGGSLVQHIPHVVDEGHEVHFVPVEDGGWNVVAHDVNMEPDSRLGAIFGQDSLSVNSMHHQMIDRVGEGLRVAGRSAEGVIEAIESTGEECIFGVQWHPEMLVIGPHAQPHARKLFQAFIESL